MHLQRPDAARPQPPSCPCRRQRNQDFPTCDSPIVRSAGITCRKSIGTEFLRGLTLCRNARPVRLLHDSLNRNRFTDKIMQKLKALQRPLRV
ncbi:hypothetical protein GHK62_05785 [Sinorhizobium terangae]|uniref:Uncharacterized protein n=1 Tax=Sinorhizobium terangae TaxID=110322 RepID=A0A6N7LBJ6_SINTE|nr:hypothetical protein [Sinorhizobium terangae]